MSGESVTMKTRKYCPTCGRMILLTTKGVFRAHRRFTRKFAGHEPPVCAGSGMTVSTAAKEQRKK